MSKLAVTALSLAILLAVAIAPGPGGKALAGDEAIRIALTGELGQEITARVAGEALRQAEYEIDFIEVAPDQVFAQLAAGEVHLQPEVWTETAGAAYQAALEAKGIARLGALGIEPRSVLKVSWRNAAIKWSGAIKMMRTLSLSDAQRDAMIAAVEQRGLTPEAAVAEWMAANPKVWQRWMTSNRNWMTPN